MSHKGFRISKRAFAYILRKHLCRPPRYTPPKKLSKTVRVNRHARFDFTFVSSYFMKSIFLTRPFRICFLGVCVCVSRSGSVYVHALLEFDGQEDVDLDSVSSWISTSIPDAQVLSGKSPLLQKQCMMAGTGNIEFQRATRLFSSSTTSLIFSVSLF